MSRRVFDRSKRDEPVSLAVHNVTAVTPGEKGAVLAVLTAHYADGQEYHPNQWIPRAHIHDANRLELAPGNSGAITVKRWWVESMRLQQCEVRHG